MKTERIEVHYLLYVEAEYYLVLHGPEPVQGICKSIEIFFSD